MDVRLILIEGGKKVIVRPKLPTVVGRNTQADVKVPDSQVSRRHCELYDYEGQLAVRDLGSVNGTLVNQHRIDQDTFLSTGDTLSIGSVTFRVEVDAPDPQAMPPEQLKAEGAPTAAHEPSAVTTAEPANDSGVVMVEPESTGSTVHSESAVLNYEASESGSFIGISPPAGGESGQESPAAQEDEEEEDDGLADFLKGLG